jgi:hypothetical protein
MAKNSLKKIKKLDALLYSFEKDLETIKAFQKQLKLTQKKAKKLSNYMTEEWMEDFDKFQNEKGLHILGEDYLYNSLTDFAQLQQKTLISIVKGIKI